MSFQKQKNVLKIFWGERWQLQFNVKTIDLLVIVAVTILTIVKDLVIATMVGIMISCIGHVWKTRNELEVSIEETEYSKRYVMQGKFTSNFQNYFK